MVQQVWVSSGEVEYAPERSATRHPFDDMRVACAGTAAAILSRSASGNGGNGTVQ